MSEDEDVLLNFLEGLAEVLGYEVVRKQTESLPTDKGFEKKTIEELISEIKTLQKKIDARRNKVWALREEINNFQKQAGIEFPSLFTSQESSEAERRVLLTKALLAKVLRKFGLKPVKIRYNSIHVDLLEE